MFEKESDQTSSPTSENYKSQYSKHKISSAMFENEEIKRAVSPHGDKGARVVKYLKSKKVLMDFGTQVCVRYGRTDCEAVVSTANKL